jgi:NADH:ubiquinone oxidoreductase subunit 6 (subunit J)
MLLRKLPFFAPKSAISPKKRKKGLSACFLTIVHLTGAVVLSTVGFVSVVVLGHLLARRTVDASSGLIRLLIPLCAVLLALAVAALRNPMHSLLSLIGVFLLAVVIYVANGAEFLGLVFLIVYVGAVAILFLFVIMLLNVKSLTSSDTLIERSSQLLLLDAGVYLGIAVLSFSYHAMLLQFG